jgi:hypothetical protein
MTYKNVPKRLWLLISIILLPVTLGLVRSHDEQARFAYLIDESGHYLKVNLTSTQVVRHGWFGETRELQPVMPEGREASFASQVPYDPNRHRIYVLAIEPVLGQPTKRWVVVLELPTFKLIGRMDLMNGDIVPRMLLTPDGERLLVSYEATTYESGSRDFVFFREVYDTRTFKRLEQKRYEVPREPSDPKAMAKARFSKEARFAADGKTIIDGEYEILDDQVTPHHQSVRLPKEVDDLLKRVKGRPYFTWERLDEAGQRVLLWEKQDGRDRATGRVVLYDALAQPKTREFYLKELAVEDPKIFGIWPNGRGFFFAKGREELYAVKVDKDVKPIRLELHGLQPYLSECIFADR